MNPPMGPEWVLTFFAAGLLAGFVRRWSGVLLGAASSPNGGEK